MNDSHDFSDVLAHDVIVEETVGLEFEFDGFVVRRERNHWEIRFEDSEGEQGIAIEREDFVDGVLAFDVDGREASLSLEDFDRLDSFAHEKGLVK